MSGLDFLRVLQYTRDMNKTQKRIALAAASLIAGALVGVGVGLALPSSDHSAVVEGGAPAIAGAPSAADLPACETVDSDNCYWNKYIRGGDTTFVRVDGITYTSDGPVEVDE